MEVVFTLGFFFLCVAVTAIALFWIQGLIYGLIRSPAVYFPFSLALKMAGASIAGALVLGFGAIVLPTAVFVFEFKKRDDFVMWRSVVIGVLISAVGFFGTLFATYWIAPAILD